MTPQPTPSPIARRHQADERPRIDVTAEQDVLHWTDVLGVSEAELRRTVAEVGDLVSDVRDRLPQRRN